MLFLLASAVASTGLGIGAGLLPGRSSKGLQRMADVRPLLEARPLGLVPAIPGGRKSRRLLLEQPESAFGESIRGVLTNLVLEGEMPTSVLVERPRGTSVAGELVLAPPSARGTPWMRRLGALSDGLTSGLMRVRGVRRQRSYDRGFVLSDHADWPGLMSAIAATGAQRIIVTHGSIPVMVKWLRQQGLDAAGFDTEYGDDDDDVGIAPQPAAQTEQAAEREEAKDA